MLLWENNQCGGLVQSLFPKNKTVYGDFSTRQHSDNCPVFASHCMFYLHHKPPGNPFDPQGFFDSFGLVVAQASLVYWPCNLTHARMCAVGKRRSSGRPLLRHSVWNI